jgi:triphosphoribosyl-dephospho-CoA synthetase
MENDAKELKSPCEFLSKKERLILGFLKDCPKPYAEIIEHLGKQKVEKRTANNLLKRAEKERRIFRIKKDGRIFCRFNDFPDQINALLLLLDNSRIENPWDKLFCEKLSYNFKTLYPRYDPKQIVRSTFLELKAIYDRSRFVEWAEALRKLDVDALKKAFPD